jgi:hypothetical protein
MKKKKILATGGLVTSMLFTGATAHAQVTTPTNNQGIIRSRSLEIITEDLELDAEDFKEELRSGKTPKEVLMDQGFDSAQIHKIFNKYKEEM